MTERVLALLALVLAIAAYLAGVQHVRDLPRPKAAESTLSVAVPPLLQVALAGGDRYLAANMGVFRAVVAGTESLDPAGYAVLARVQQDVARLNPAHEDNYYIAQSILPWAGQVEAAQDILRRATVARPRDFLPPFFLGFNTFYFQHEPIAAARAMRAAADRVSGEQRLALLNISAKYYEKSDDPAFAIGMIRGLAENSRSPALRQYLQLRIQRLEGLQALRAAAAEYRRRTDHPLRRLDDLVQARILDALPQDPLGQGYMLDPAGEPALVASPQARLQ